ncbi:MAG TPA: tRNA preQ1(34) S-adenosylmethionine ribosyltransferase-isomerase QueA [Vicinamibacterales bacterium]|nr:tRNA preQ1(34) S-adenosylmethionine ribosyltransferase-isomerase QueA [Vicinamibacterales bacterium]
MNVSDFDYFLPSELIAQEPPHERGQSRLLWLDRTTGRIADREFRHLPELLRAGDVLVVNDTRVFPARLLGRRLPGGGAVECLLVRRIETTENSEIWEALVHPGQRLKRGSEMQFERAGRRIDGEILDRHFHGRRTVRLWSTGCSVEEAVEAVGHVPLPPYIKRDDVASDRERYQTVYATARGSIAAPTAGLHFSPALLDALARCGVERATLTLHVGYGTFQPVRVATVEEHQMEPEEYDVTEETAAALSRALSEKRRVVAVGTTTTRALESLRIAKDEQVLPGRGLTNLFIYPGYEFRIVSGLITNFHLPRSSLLMLVAAFGGRERVLGAYRHAVHERYRFYSYGDAMVVI